MVHRGLEGLSDAAINKTTLAAVDRGENVQAIARRHGVESLRVIGLLEQHATYARHVIADLARGDTVPAIAERYGILSAGGVEALDARAVQTVGERAVRRGEAASAVVARLGITSQIQIDRLGELLQRRKAPSG